MPSAWGARRPRSRVDADRTIAIGVAAALARRSGFFVLRALSRIYVETIRGTPLLVQISFAFYVIASAIHLENRFVVGIGTLAIFSEGGSA